MNIVNFKVEELIPYINNPRNNNDAVDKVAASIKEFGFKVPIVIDKDNVVVTGHTRLLASKKLGLKEVPCVIADDLSPAQIKAFRIADNKVSEYAEWDEDMLKVELEELEEMNFDLDSVSIDFSDFDMALDLEDTEEEQEQKENTYTREINIPQYEITGECPELNELVNEEKTKSLIERIEKSDIPKEIKEFLIKASYRHLAFNYQNIAEYYAHADKEVQELMEESALVIIDLDNAIRNGYVTLNKAILEMVGED